MNNKIIFIPGWMRSLAYYGKYTGLDVWKEKLSINFRWEADYVIAHSLGSTIALLNWKNNSQKKLILVNPLVARRNFLRWMWRWLQFALVEGLQVDKQVGIASVFFGMKKFYQLSSVDVGNILKNIPVGDLVIIRGRNDRFFCTEEDCVFLKNNNFDLIEVDDVGHQWHEKFDIEIDKIINFR